MGAGHVLRCTPFCGFIFKETCYGSFSSWTTCCRRGVRLVSSFAVGEVSVCAVVDVSRTTAAARGRPAAVRRRRRRPHAPRARHGDPHHRGGWGKKPFARRRRKGVSFIPFPRARARVCARPHAVCPHARVCLYKRSTRLTSSRYRARGRTKRLRQRRRRRRRRLHVLVSGCKQIGGHVITTATLSLRRRRRRSRYNTLLGAWRRSSARPLLFVVIIAFTRGPVSVRSRTVAYYNVISIIVIELLCCGRARTWYRVRDVRTILRRPVTIYSRSRNVPTDFIRFPASKSPYNPCSRFVSGCLVNGFLIADRKIFYPDIFVITAKTFSHLSDSGSQSWKFFIL